MRLENIYFALMLMFMFCFSSVAHAAPAIRIDDAVWNAGIIVSGKTYEKTIAIENAGDELLVIEKIEECCGFFGEIKGNMRLAPGEKVPLLLRLAPFKFVGELKAEMFVLSNDPSQQKYSVFALAQVVPSNHALGELKASEIDLGVLDVRDRVPFAVTIRNVGNVPLTMRQVERPAVVGETGYRPQIEPGKEATLTFEYIPKASGPIDEKISFVSNDALNRVLEFRIKGYVSKEGISSRALSIYPIMGEVVYDVIKKVYRYEFTMKNEGPVSVHIAGAESDLEHTRLEYDEFVSSGKQINFTATVPLNHAKQGTHHITLQLRLPFEIQ